MFSLIFENEPRPPPSTHRDVEVRDAVLEQSGVDCVTVQSPPQAFPEPHELGQGECVAAINVDGGEAVMKGLRGREGKRKVRACWGRKITDADGARTGKRPPSLTPADPLDARALSRGLGGAPHPGAAALPAWPGSSACAKGRVAVRGR